MTTMMMMPENGNQMAVSLAKITGGREGERQKRGTEMEKRRVLRDE